MSLRSSSVINCHAKVSSTSLLYLGFCIRSIQSKMANCQACTGETVLEPRNMTSTALLLLVVFVTAVGQLYSLSYLFIIFFLYFTHYLIYCILFHFTHILKK